MPDVSIVTIVFIVAVCALIAWIATQHSAAKMKTARSKSQARDYFKNGSFELVEHSDEFVDSKTEVKPKTGQKGGEAHA